ncbi:MAG: hypothetical protein JWM80_3657 [Cyanobacteria bacterium RYN_339]|nr:hypothetical protein [Cyanobacteria bacterium RYN_339]
MKLPAPVDGISDLSEILAPAMKPGEALVWCGQPHRLRARLHTHVAVIMGGLGLGGFTAARLLGDAELPARSALLATLAFMIAGMVLAALVFRALLAWRRRRTVYGLTPDAAIIASGSPFGRTVLVDLRGVPTIDLALGPHDLGTITFGRGEGAPAFHDVRHARHVFDLARSGRPEGTP